SGGCLETQVAEQGEAVLRSGEPVLLTFDTTDPSDILFGTGTGCRGVVDLLIERVPPGDRLAAQLGFAETGPQHVLRFAAERLRARERGVVATVVAAPKGCGARVGDHLFLGGAEGTEVSELADPLLAETVAAAAREHLAGGPSRVVPLPSAAG